MKFIIYSSGYDHDIGGIIVLHKLCDQLNALGHRAFLNPRLKPIFPKSFRILYNVLDWIYPSSRKAYKRNAILRTPLRPIIDRLSKADTVVIYPEAISGNPLGADNVVRWFLHQPGFHDPNCQYGPGEFQIDFNEFLKGYQTGDNHVSAHRLHVLHFPTDLYNLDGAAPADLREGTAYCVRKGTIDVGSVDLSGAICIDGMSHAECADILKRVKYFYSFDLYTAYSAFAALCGAISIVLPPQGMPKSDWYADETNRYGIGFGPEEEDWAIQTRDRVLSQFRAHEAASLQSVAIFVDEVRGYFGIES